MTDNEKRTSPPIVNLVADPVRCLMEAAAESRARLTAVADDPVDLDQQTQAAARAAAAVVAADPAIGPAEVIYIGANADVPDMRYLIVLFEGERAFLFDRVAGKTTIVELNDGGVSGDQRLEAKLESARAAAAREKLSKVYVVIACDVQRRRLMAQLQKFTEWLADGRKTHRVAYVTDVSSLPSPVIGAEWKEALNFNADEEIRDRPELKVVYKAALSKGFAIYIPKRINRKFY